MKVDILGTKYKIIFKKYSEDPAFEKNSVCAYCDGYSRKIVVCVLSTYKGWEDEPKETIENCQKETLRHEIVHAFFNESGLLDSALRPDCAWSKNEEMVDWIARQGKKIYAAWECAGAL